MLFEYGLKILQDYEKTKKSGHFKPFYFTRIENAFIFNTFAAIRTTGGSYLSFFVCQAKLCSIRNTLKHDPPVGRIAYRTRIEKFVLKLLLHKKIRFFKVIKYNIIIGSLKFSGVTRNFFRSGRRGVKDYKEEAFFFRKKK